MLKRVFLLLILVSIVATAAAHAKPKVLFIESYHESYKWDQELTEGVESVLKDRVDLYNFHMDTKRLPSSEYFARADMAWEYYQELKPDVVVLSDDNAMMLLAARFLKTDTPVVYMGVNNNPRSYAPLGENITGVLERPLYKRTVKYLKELLYIGKGKVLILMDKSTTTETFKYSIFHDKNSQTISGITTDVKLISRYDDWKAAVTNATNNGYKAIIIGLYHRIFDNGVYVDSEQVLHWTSIHSPVPVFGFWAMSVGKGKAVGGMVLSGKVQGRAAGKIVMQILDGVPVNRIQPVIPDHGEFNFSRSELERWRIRLPRSIKEHSIMVD